MTKIMGVPGSHESKILTNLKFNFILAIFLRPDCMKLDIQIFLEYILLLTLIVYDIIHKEQKVGTTFNIGI